MDQRVLQHFLNLADSLHFGRAAEASHISPSALSRSIQRLEDEVGAPLFERNNRSVSLTGAGRLFLDYARGAMDDWETIRNNLMAASGELRGEVSMFCSVTASYSFLFDILDRFRRDHPRVEIKLHTGDPEEGQRAIEPIRGLGTPYGEHVGVQPFTDWQQAFDPLLTPGARNYWKSHNFTELSDGLIEKVVAYAAKLPSPQSEIFIAQLGGAINQVPAAATAYPHRDAEFVMNVHTRWEKAKDDEKCVSWARDFFDATAPFATGGVYVNFMTEDEGGRVGDAYGPNFKRLVALKKKYDPANFFRLNQNIKPE